MAKMFFGERHDRVTRDQIELSANEADSLAIRMLQLSLEIKSSRSAALDEGSCDLFFVFLRPSVRASALFFSDSYAPCDQAAQQTVRWQ